MLVIFSPLEKQHLNRICRRFSVVLPELPLTGVVSSGKSSDILSETNIAALLAMQGDMWILTCPSKTCILGF